MPALPVRNPRTGLYDYQIDPATPAELSAISAQLRAAQPAWEALGPQRPGRGTPRVGSGHPAAA
ncbi:MAG: hypothetical protein KatS3mg061_2878 [Dehalococcoidia bacterium]|nr:MAG: hypothetical protein KatS3mg061_2878 [Dehalococcoidia bacterium]